MKYILSLILLFVMCGTVSAEASYFMEQKDACFFVDLGNQYFNKHNDDAIFSNNYKNVNDPNYYSDNEIIAVIGVQGSAEETKLTFNFTGNAWYYILNGTDTRYRRPFGIDLVVRAAVKPNAGDKDQKTIEKIIHLGRQSKGEDKKSVTVTLPKTDGSTYKGQTIYAAWLDLVLVMDPFVNPDTGLISENGVDITKESSPYYGYVIGTDDFYTTSCTVSVANTGQSYVFNMMGYYNRKKPNISSNGFVSTISVFPNANATSFDIKTLKPDNESTSSDIVIGGYSYTTSSKKVGKNEVNEDYAKAYFFVSSSPNGSVKGEEFVLKYVSPISGITVSNLNKFNSVKYQIGIKGKSGNTKWFNGEDFFGSIVLEASALKAVTSVEWSSNHNQYIVRVFDEGEILLKIAGDVDDLSAGRYRSNVYFHVVTDW